jgi:hypothetical protein
LTESADCVDPQSLRNNNRKEHLKKAQGVGMRSDTSEPRLVPLRTVDKSTGSSDVTYQWDGKVAPKIQLTGKLVDKLSGYSLIKKDLDNALRWMKKAESISANDPSRLESGYFQPKDRDAFDDVKAYFVASLAFYGKCFTEAAGRHAGVSRAWLDPDYRAVHDYYMKYRHNFVAHSGDEQLEIAKTYVLLRPNRKNLLPFFPTTRSQPDIVLSNDGDIGFPELIAHVTTKVVEKYDKIGYKIGECLASKGIYFWISAAEEGHPVCIDECLKGQANR